MIRLVRTDGPETFELEPGRKLMLGRGPLCDLPVSDPTISRQHAELFVADDTVTFTDLGSSNGTLLNGKRTQRGKAQLLDTLTFGRAVFRLEPAGGSDSVSVTGDDIVSEVPVDSDVRDALINLDAAASEGSHIKVDERDSSRRSARKLGLLLELSQRLSAELDLDRLLESAVAKAFEVLAVDRVAILLVDPQSGDLVPRVSRSVLGDLPSRAVPRSIVERVRKDRVAVLSQNTAADSRFSGQSIMAQSIRSAMCTPLMGSAGQVLGILYVDSVTAANSFSNEDLQFLVAFGGIASAGIRASMQADELRQQAVVRGTFERYFAPEVAAEIARSAGAARLGGERRPIAVLFSDVRGFTGLAEGMPPEALAALLTDYFTAMVDLVFEHGGTLDKFVGDAIMALWGAPQAQPDAADRAVRAAVAMQATLIQQNELSATQGRPVLEIGIGINYGEVFAGNIGSHRRLEYTVLGDVVNVAARLCAEAGPGEILVGEGVRQQLAPSWQLEKLTPSEMRGREGKVERYRIKH